MPFYFAYGSNLNNKAVTDWCRAHGFRPPNLKTGVPAVLDNYRLCFPFYNEYWGGGVADIAYDPGKYVSGVVFDLPETDLKALDEKVGRKVDAAGREIGVYKRIDVPISPLKGKRVEGFTYQGVRVEKYHIPPTKHYMKLLLEGVFSHGMSMMWASYLQSFSVQEGRPPRAGTPRE